mgnify:CR=1 FL=1
MEDKKKKKKVNKKVKKIKNFRDLTTPLAKSVMTKTFITSPLNVKWKEKYK